ALDELAKKKVADMPGFTGAAARCAVSDGRLSCPLAVSSNADGPDAARLQNFAQNLPALVNFCFAGAPGYPPPIRGLLHGGEAGLPSSGPAGVAGGQGMRWGGDGTGVAVDLVLRVVGPAGTLSIEASPPPPPSDDDPDDPLPF